MPKPTWSSHFRKVLQRQFASQSRRRRLSTILFVCLVTAHTFGSSPVPGGQRYAIERTVPGNENSIGPLQAPITPQNDKNQSTLLVVVATENGRLIIDRLKSQSGFTVSDEFRRILRVRMSEAQVEKAITTYLDELLNDLDTKLASLPKVYRYALSDKEEEKEPVDSLTKEISAFTGSWEEFKTKFEAWVGAGENRIDLKEVFSGAGILMDVNDIGRESPLIFNTRVTRPPLPFKFNQGTLTFKVADPIDNLEDAEKYQIRFPNEPDAAKAASKRKQVLKMIKSFEGKLWRAVDIKSRIEDYYSERGLVGIVKISPAGKEPRFIEIPEGARISRVLFSKDVPTDAIDKVAYLLLPDKDFRVFIQKRPLKPLTGINGELAYNSVDYLDLGHTAGREPFINQFQFQIQQLELSQLGYVAFQADTPNEVRDQSTGSSYVKIFVNIAEDEESGKEPENVVEPASLVPNEEGRLAARPERLERRTGFVPSTPNLAADSSAPEAVTGDGNRPSSNEPPATPSPSPLPSTNQTDNNQWSPKDKKNYVGFGISYKPGQNIRVFGIFQRQRLGLLSNEDDLSIKAGAAEDALGSLNYSADYVLFNSIHRRLSLQFSGISNFQPNRLFAGVKTDQRQTGGLARAELEIFRDRGGQAWRVFVEGRQVTVHLIQNDLIVFKQNLATLDIGSLYLFESRTAYYPKQLRLEPRLRIGLGLASGEPAFTSFQLNGNYHQQLPRGLEVDVTGHLNIATNQTPLYELPSFGGADSLRGFREDDAIGQSLWSLQNEMWFPIPGTVNAEKGLRRFLRRQVRLAAFIDLGAVYDAVGSQSGMRMGPGVGARIIYKPAIIKLDWAYGIGDASSTGNGHGRFYFSVGTNLPF